MSTIPGSFRARRGTAAAWTSANPILAAGEGGFATDTGTFKIGNGTNTWSALPTVNAVAGGEWMHQGFKAWNADLNTVSVTETAGLTSGTLYLQRLYVPAAATITNLHMWINTAGTVTGAYMALFNSAGVLLSQSASIHAGWSTGMKTYPLGSPQAVAAGAVYCGCWFVHSVSPGLIRPNMGTGLIVNSGLAAPNLRQANSTTGLTTTAPNPFGTQTSNNFAFWVAAS